MSSIFNYEDQAGISNTSVFDKTAFLVLIEVHLSIAIIKYVIEDQENMNPFHNQIL